MSPVRVSHRALAEWIRIVVKIPDDTGQVRPPTAPIRRRFAKILAEGYSNRIMWPFLVRWGEDARRLWLPNDTLAVSFALGHLLATWRQEAEGRAYDRAFDALQRSLRAKGFVVTFLTPWRARVRAIPRIAGSGRPKLGGYHDLSIPAVAMLAIGGEDQAYGKVTKYAQRVRACECQACSEYMEHLRGTIGPIGEDHQYDPDCTCFWCSGWRR